VSQAELVEDLVAANRILADHGVLDAYGHISARDTSNQERYWLSRSMAPVLVTAEDIIAFDLDNRPLHAGENRLFFERVIHGEIYKARPDVMAVVHNHSPSLIPFCNSDTRLRPMVGNAAFLGTGAPVFDIRTVDDEGDLNICTVPQARGLANALGRHCIVLLRGHGAVAVGDSIRQCVRHAIIAERNAKQQIEAAALGPVHFLTDSEIAFAKRMKPKDPERAWQLWKRKAMSS
jgi:ribulose-5-phosphate 4-epimerase/fuculose-1-phosphate aldolase